LYNVYLLFAIEVWPTKEVGLKNAAPAQRSITFMVSKIRLESMV